MGRFKDYKLLAAVLGILVTAGPVLWFTAWLQKQGEAEVSVAASWTIGNADPQIGRAVAVLEALAARGVDGCGAAQLELLRQRLLQAGPVKELSVVGTHGPTLCTDRGNCVCRPRDDRLRADRESRDRARCGAARRATTSGCCACAGWCPSSQHIAGGAAAGRAAAAAGRARRHAASPATPASRSSDDTVVGVAGSDRDADLARRPDRQPRALRPLRLRGDGRHGPQDGVFATYDDLRRIGMVVTGLLALSSWRRADHAVAASAQPVLRHRARHRRRRVRALLPADRRHQDPARSSARRCWCAGASATARWSRPATFIPFLETDRPDPRS